MKKNVRDKKYSENNFGKKIRSALCRSVAVTPPSGTERTARISIFYSKFFLLLFLFVFSLTRHGGTRNQPVQRSIASRSAGVAYSWRQYLLRVEEVLHLDRSSIRPCWTRWSISYTLTNTAISCAIRVHCQNVNVTDVASYCTLDWLIGSKKVIFKNTSHKTFFSTYFPSDSFQISPNWSQID